MQSFKFPKMFKSNCSNIWRSDEHHEATRQNLLLLLQSKRGELFGDPYFGLNISNYLFDQNNYILKDIIIDTIYNQIAIFIPQLKISRNSIDIYQSDSEPGKLFCSFNAINQIDFVNDTYSLLLFNQSDF